MLCMSLESRSSLSVVPTTRTVISTGIGRDGDRFRTSRTSETVGSSGGSSDGTKRDESDPVQGEESPWYSVPNKNRDVET